MGLRRPQRCFASLTAILLGALVCSFAFFGPSTVNAQPPIEYGNIMGDDVTFVGVTETSVTENPYPAGGLFGTPTVTGNSMDFNPVGFAAFAQDGSSDITDGQLVFMVVAKEGQAVRSIKFNEAGLVTLVGSGDANTKASVDLSVFIDIQEVNGVGVNTVSFTPNDLPGPIFASEADGEWDLANNGNIQDPWSGMLFLDLETLLVNSPDRNFNFVPGTDRITKISVDLDNQLVAMSQAGELAGGTQALIDKKDFFTVIINVPEPASFAVALLGLMTGSLFVGRFRR